MGVVILMKLWIDDLRRPPSNDYVWNKTVNEAIHTIHFSMRPDGTHLIDTIDIDHDAGEYAWDGGDYIEVLKWMERKQINDIAIHIHSMNPVGIQNMRAIIKHNNWMEIL